MCALIKRLRINVTIIASAIALVSCMPIECKDTVLSESWSPQGKIIATVFERDCGATTAKNIQVCFRSSAVAFDPKKQESFLVLETDKKIELIWTNEEELIVQIPNQARVFREKIESSGVKIKYFERNE